MMWKLRDQYLPRRKSGPSPWKVKGRIPIAVEVRNLIKEKKQLHRRWMRSKNEMTKENLEKQYKKVRNKVKKVMTHAKYAYEKNICESSIQNPKAFWSHIRNSMKTKTSVSPLTNLNSSDSKLKFEDSEKADILQSQFSSVFTHEPSGDLPKFEQRTEKTFFLTITKDMVQKETNNSDASKAPGPDEITL